MRIVIIDDRPVQAAIELIGYVLRVEGVIRHADRLRKGVRTQQGQSASEVPGHLCLQRVVARISDIWKLVRDPGKLRIRTQRQGVRPVEAWERLWNRTRCCPWTRQQIA